MKPFKDYVGILPEKEIRFQKGLSDLSKTFSSLVGTQDVFVGMGGYYGDAAWTSYQEGKIYFQRIPDNFDAVSFYFTGCAMAKFTYTDGSSSSNYICHIYLEGVGGNNDTRKHWNNFVKHESISNIILFYPYNYFKVISDDLSYFLNHQAVGVIDRLNSCKTFLVDVVERKSVAEYELKYDEIIGNKEIVGPEYVKGKEKIIICNPSSTQSEIAESSRHHSCRI
ncbi:MAG: hypothetical protein LBM63_00775 [Rikenellaceae bacterium]|jgi:hypothetical protein|nr:hypothetical protein [Rikenellaceae bacterium]